jgi:uncharacterized phiE125 gp8 family phage protein
MKRGQYQIKILPIIEPITLTEAKAHLKVDFDEEDALILIYISAAREYAEQFCNRGFLTQTIVHSLDAFPQCSIQNPLAYFRLYRTPVQALVSLKYIDTENVEQTIGIENLVLSKIDIPAKLGKLDAYTWPETANVPGAVSIEYTCGVATAAEVPAAIKAAILLMVGEMYEQRENKVKKLPTAAESLMSPFRIREF